MLRQQKSKFDINNMNQARVVTLRIALNGNSIHDLSKVLQVVYSIKMVENLGSKSYILVKNGRYQLFKTLTLNYYEIVLKL